MIGRLALTAVFVLALVPRTGAYHVLQHVTPDGDVVELSWLDADFPVPYYVNNTTPLDFSLDAAVTAVNQSFQIWEDVETADITFSYAGLTSAEPFQFFDGRSTLGFTSDPDLALPGVLGATLQVINIFSGEIVEADIFFSNRFVWSVNPAGEPNTYDFVSTATHEIGHFLGLDHSHVGFMESIGGGRREVVSGASIMYPFAYGPGTVEGRALTDDDIAGLSVIYPTGIFVQTTGRLAGFVTKGGSGVAFAHVVAFNPFTGTTIGSFTDESGAFTIRGLPPGPHTVRVNPISDPVEPGDFGFPTFGTDLSYSDALYRGGAANVSPGSTTGGIDIEVQP